jgi:hypothetical protein
MSTSIVVACPGCDHIRCNHCPVENVMTRRGEVVGYLPPICPATEDVRHRPLSMVP